MGLFHSFVTFYFPFWMLSFEPFNLDAYAIFSNHDFGMLVFTAIVVVVNLTLFYLTKYWIAFTHVMYWGTLLVYFVFSIGFSYARSDVFLTFLQAFSVAPPLLCLLLSTVVCLLPVVIIIVVHNHNQSHARLTMRRLGQEMQQLSVDTKNSDITNSLSATPLIQPSDQRSPEDEYQTVWSENQARDVDK